MFQFDIKTGAKFLKWIAQILNSRIGLVLLFMLYTSSPYGLGSKMDQILENTAILKKTLDLEIQNSDMIARILDRCHITNYGERSNEPR